MDRVKIIGIMGSHQKNRNTAFALQCAVEAASQLGDWIETEVIDLSTMRINQCLANMNCYFTAAYDHPCPEYGMNDDMNKHRVIQRMIEADGFIVASPVYFGSVSGKLKVFMDRTVMCCHGSSVPALSGKLENKVGGAIAIARAPHGGVELTLNAIYMWMINHDMIVVGPGMYPPAGCITGGGAYEMIARDVRASDAIRSDIYGMRSIRHVGKRVAEVATYMKFGRKPAEEFAEEIKPTYKEGKIRIDWNRFFAHGAPYVPREHVSICEYVGIAKNGFEKYLDFKRKQVLQADKSDKKAWEQGLQDPEKFKNDWLTRERVVFLSDEQIYRCNPEFWDQWVKGETSE